MNRTDALVAAIGAGVLVVALLGAALTGSEVVGGGSFAVSWATRQAEHDLGTQTVTGSGETTFTFENPHANLTRLRFEVVASAAAPHLAAQGDRVLVTVTAPDGNESTAEGTLGVGPGSTTVTVDVALASTPQATTAEGATSGAAEANLAQAHADLSGIGTWTVLVQISHGSPSPEAHTVAVVASPEWYEAEVAPDVPVVR